MELGEKTREQKRLTPGQASACIALIVSEAHLSSGIVREMNCTTDIGPKLDQGSKIVQFKGRISPYLKKPYPKILHFLYMKSCQW